VSATLDQLVTLVSQARAQGVALWVSTDGTLQAHAPPDTSTEHLLAELLKHRVRVAGLLSGPTFVSRGEQQRVPFLTFYRNLWSRIRQGIVDTSFTNNTYWLTEIHGDFDAHLMEKCVAQLVRKHPVLGVRVESTDQGDTFVYGTAVQMEHSAQPCDGPDFRTQLEPHVSDIVWRPFGSNDPLFRAFAIQGSTNYFVFGFVLHHIIGDAISIGIISNELVHAYRSAKAGAPNRIPPPAIHYSDYVLAVNSWLESQAFEYRLRFWNTKLTGIKPSRLRGQNVDPNSLAEFGVVPFELNPTQIKNLFALARRFSTTPYFVLLAAQARAMSRVTGKRDLAFVTMHHGRDFPGSVSMIGSAQTQLLLRVRINQDQPLEAVVAACGAVHREAVEHRISYEIVSRIVSDDALHWFPEFNCMIGSRPSNAGAAARGLSQSSYRLPPRWLPPSRRRHFPSFKLNYFGNQSQVVGSVNFCSSELDSATVAEFVAMTHKALDEVAPLPEATHDTAMLTAS
jgi:hypothetical protein